MEEQIKKLEKVAYHRNGVCGIGFTVGIAQCELEGYTEQRKMLIVQFSPENGNKDLMMTSVFDLGLLKKDVIEFGENSWRGDRFATEFREKSEIMLEESIRSN